MFGTISTKNVQDVELINRGKSPYHFTAVLLQYIRYGENEI